ncbi:MAG TPA: alpha/beta hydrolase [Ferruginibacter sp.]|nr:alpha/beta hydrolase [Ferruginibacter sp.]
MKQILFISIIVLLALNGLAKSRELYMTTSDNVTLYVKVSGHGKPCVFIHGGPGSNSYYYEAMASSALIEKEVEMIYYDQRGCGRSSSPANGDYSLKRMEKDLEEIRIFLGYKKWMLMAHSFGGVIQTAYASDYPEQVMSLLYIHCTLNMNYSLQSHIDFGIQALGISDPKPYTDSSKPVGERLSAIHQQLTEKGIWYKLMYRNPWEKTYNDTIDNPIKPNNRDFANTVWNIRDYWADFTAASKLIKAPVLVMTGIKDYAIGPEHYKQFQFPDQKIVRYIGGHAPFQEEPQWYAEKIISFVQQLKN